MLTDEELAKIPDTVRAALAQRLRSASASFRAQANAFLAKSVRNLQAQAKHGLNALDTTDVLVVLAGGQRSLSAEGQAQVKLAREVLRTGAAQTRDIASMWKGVANWTAEELGVRGPKAGRQTTARLEALAVQLRTDARPASSRDMTLAGMQVRYVLGELGLITKQHRGGPTEAEKRCADVQDCAAWSVSRRFCKTRHAPRRRVPSSPVCHQASARVLPLQMLAQFYPLIDAHEEGAARKQCQSLDDVEAAAGSLFSDPDLLPLALATMEMPLVITDVEGVTITPDVKPDYTPETEYNEMLDRLTPSSTPSIGGATPGEAPGERFLPAGWLPQCHAGAAAGRGPELRAVRA